MLEREEILERELYMLARVRKGLKQSEVAKALGINHSTVSNIEAGKQSVKKESVLKYRRYIESFY